MEEKVYQRWREWRDNPYFDQETRGELAALADEKEIEDRFYRDLEFGTGGMRGVLGAGTNRMNRYIVRRITAALAAAILAAGNDHAGCGVVIAYDSRRCSLAFAKETAAVLAASGVRAYLFDHLRPTPELSFAVRKLGAAAGVIITASHNPKEYNGYKVYWRDGGQIPPRKAQEIVGYMEQQEGWQVPLIAEGEARAAGLLVTVGEEVDAAYLAAVKAQLPDTALTAKRGDNLRVVYTPLHGAGCYLAPRLLAEIGFCDVEVVPAQSRPDGDFPTVAEPNPEEDGAFAEALALARAKGGEIVLATDPDGDRAGVYGRCRDGSYRRFTGNEIGVLLANYLLSRWRERGPLPADGVIVKSVVSTALAAKIAAAFNVGLVEVPVGFKFIGEKIKEMEESGDATFLWGFEESLGYLTGTYARDKDGILAVALVAEAALYYKEQDRTLAEVMEEIYERYGYFLDEQVAKEYQGVHGRGRIEDLMAAMRNDRRLSLGGLPIVSREDYLRGQKYEGEGACPLDFPPVDLYRYSLADGGFVMARPSGTEPKIRFYFCIGGADRPTAQQNLRRVKEDFFTALQNLL